MARSLNNSKTSRQKSIEHSVETIRYGDDVLESTLDLNLQSYKSLRRGCGCKTDQMLLKRSLSNLKHYVRF